MNKYDDHTDPNAFKDLLAELSPEYQAKLAAAMQEKRDVAEAKARKSNPHQADQDEQYNLLFTQPRSKPTLCG
jgi:hypothetical protein